jgi:hypothetical protein
MVLYGPRGQALAPVGPEDTIPFGTLQARVEAAKTRAYEWMKVDPVRGQAQLKVLEDLEAELAARANSPELTRLKDEYGRMKALNDLVWGEPAPPGGRTKGESLPQNLVDREGRLTYEGFGDLKNRLETRAPRMDPRLDPEDLKVLHDGFGVTGGLTRPEEGAGIRGLLPKLSVSPAGGHMYVNPIPGGDPILNYWPGWETAQGWRATLPPAVRALVAPQPLRAAPLAPEPPPGPESAAPTAPANWFANLVSPRAAEAATPGPPAPTPTRGPVDRWFNAPAAPAAKELEVNLSTSQVPGE